MSGRDAGERTVKSLQDFLAFSEMAARIVSGGKAAYDSDEITRLAAEAVLHRLGESVARLPAEFVASHPEVSWRGVKATRNLVAHNYDVVDHTILWNLLANRLPGKAALVRQLLADLETAEG
ncbi:HepT-like ribonuclease domain-containing protein [Nocardia sp. FBN12]|uniref:HepT-like ribonuclease domain-containing protein n=1 Tax=Nocardia sp. FBN12 TaxID=3419766 RepID=UPI003D02690A